MGLKPAEAAAVAGGRAGQSGKGGDKNNGQHKPPVAGIRM